MIFVCTIILMKITFNPAKDVTNTTKHGVSMALADQFEWDTAVIWIDNRKDYGEPRMCGIGYIGLRLFFVVFVDRADNRRIISLRKANRREIERYAKT
jgi:uncharacterized DUF497 family protein